MSSWFECREATESVSEGETMLVLGQRRHGHGLWPGCTVAQCSSSQIMLSGCRVGIPSDDRGNQDILSATHAV